MSNFKEDDNRLHLFQMSLVSCMTLSAMVLYYFSDAINAYVLNFDGYGLLPMDKANPTVEVVLSNIIVAFKFSSAYAFAFWLCVAALGIIVSFLVFMLRASKTS